MSKRKPGGRPTYIKSTPRKRKRSYEAPLWALGAALVIGYPLVRDATADRMARKTYANSSSCVCAYSAEQCSRSGDRWVGPWYAVAADDRAPDDPGEGRRCGSGRSSGSSAYYTGDSRKSSDIQPSTGIEKGYRGGFGNTGRIRAAGS